MLMNAPVWLNETIVNGIIFVIEVLPLFFVLLLLVYYLVLLNFCFTKGKITEN